MPVTAGLLRMISLIQAEAHEVDLEVGETPVLDDGADALGDMRASAGMRVVEVNPVPVRAFFPS